MQNLSKAKVRHIGLSLFNDVKLGLLLKLKTKFSTFTRTFTQSKQKSKDLDMVFYMCTTKYFSIVNMKVDVKKNEIYYKQSL